MGGARRLIMRQKMGEVLTADELALLEEYRLKERIRQRNIRERHDRRPAGQSLSSTPQSSHRRKSTSPRLPSDSGRNKSHKSGPSVPDPAASKPQSSSTKAPAPADSSPLSSESRNIMNIGSVLQDTSTNPKQENISKSAPAPETTFQIPRPSTASSPPPPPPPPPSDQPAVLPPPRPIQPPPLQPLITQASPPVLHYPPHRPGPASHVDVYHSLYPREPLVSTPLSSDDREPLVPYTVMIPESLAGPFYSSYCAFMTGNFHTPAPMSAAGVVPVLYPPTLQPAPLDPNYLHRHHPASGPQSDPISLPSPSASASSSSSRPPAAAPMDPEMAYSLQSRARR
ncbi:hypothetical protein BZA70DRAFT_270091 [Myxozyma melibiosi]|uniref:Uncharacterized protein n=1 Tax=Myxozyma melibiosi TaxID=54550 RepID=A0ABR1EXU6_9ASCO